MVTLAPMHVLVVDDDRDSADALSLMLGHLGHDAQVATSAESALANCTSCTPDAMFIDLAMPSIDGISMAQLLRAMPAFAQTPLVAVSGYTNAKNRVMAIEAGFNAFLAKPIPLDSLMDTLGRVRRLSDTACERIARSQIAAEQTRLRLQKFLAEIRANQASRCAEPIRTSVEKSGISNIVTLSDRSAADHLRTWLKLQRCRVGPVFEPTSGCFAFFVYSRRHCIKELINMNGGFSA